MCSSCTVSVSFPTAIYPACSADVRVKIVYILSIGIGLIGCIVASLAKTTGVLLGMRVLQAVGYVRLLSSHLSSFVLL